MTFISPSNYSPKSLFPPLSRSRLFLLCVIPFVLLFAVFGCNYHVLAEALPHEQQEDEIQPEVADMFELLLQGTMSSPLDEAASPTPFTEPGQGSIVDNAQNADGKEFFTITTACKNTFYLIIDRERSTDNVYFLRAVKEDDLLDFVTVIPTEPLKTEPKLPTGSPITPTNPSNAIEQPLPTEAHPSVNPEITQQQLLTIAALVIGIIGTVITVFVWQRRRKAKQDSPNVSEYDEDDTDNDPWADEEEEIE